MGLYRRNGGTSAQEFDDVTVWLDNDEDGILDVDDDVQVDDDFNSGTITLSYDDAGNLTADGVYQYVYDAWNRLRQVQRVAAGDTTTIAEYAYDGQNRRTVKTVSHCGPEATPHDGGDTAVHFYYDRQWRIVETRDGSSQALAQYVWGTRYVDELLFMDLNGDPAETDDCDPDTAAGGEADQDRRYFVHQDRNWNVVALTEYDDGVGTDGRVAERYAYTPYGEFVVLTGDGGSGELGAVRPTSPAGNLFAHQGLAFDREKGSYQNRHREYAVGLERFGQRDPVGYVDGLGEYVAHRSCPSAFADPRGTWIVSAIRSLLKWRRCCNCDVRGGITPPFCFEIHLGDAPGAEPIEIGSESCVTLGGTVGRRKCFAIASTCVQHCVKPFILHCENTGAPGCEDETCPDTYFLHSWTTPPYDCIRNFCDGPCQSTEIVSAGDVRP